MSCVAMNEAGIVWSGNTDHAQVSGKLALSPSPFLLIPAPPPPLHLPRNLGPPPHHLLQQIPTTPILLPIPLCPSIQSLPLPPRSLPLLSPHYPGHWATLR